MQISSPDVLAVGIDQRFTPLVDIFRELGGDIGSFNSRLIYPAAPEHTRHLCMAFATHDLLDAFIAIVVARLGTDHALFELALEIGPGCAVQERTTGVFLLFWPGLCGQRYTMQ